MYQAIPCVINLKNKIYEGLKLKGNKLFNMGII